MEAVVRGVDEGQRASDDVHIQALHVVFPHRRALSIAFQVVSITPL